MSMDFSSSTNRFFIIAAFWMSMIVGAAWFDVRGFLLVQGKALSLVRARETVAALEAKRIFILEERARIKEHEEDIRRVQEVFVAVDAPLVFFETIERLAEKNKLTLHLSVPQRKAETMVMGVEVLGDSWDVFEFLERIEGLPAQVIFEQLTLERIGADRSDSGKTSLPEEIGPLRVSGIIEFLAK